MAFVFRRMDRAPKKSRKRAAERRARSRRSFSIEPLEPRIALSAAGLVPVGTQPAGMLSGKIVYAGAGHGIEYEGGSTNNGFLSDRPDYGEIVEDFGNQEQLTFYADYLFRAGATVVPMRPIGHQVNEVVLDNDSPGVTFSGAWSNSTSTRYYDEDYGAVADATPYRFASTTTGAETATATYTPNIPAAGMYPVYAWVLRGTDRTSQLYEVNHTGGQTQVRVDHSMVGSGWVYLGTYYFEAGSSPTAGSVQISNQATASGKVVIADAIRFGNGMGDYVESGAPGVSGYAREEESSYYWIARSVGVGTTLATAIGSGTTNVSAPSNFAEYMNADTNPFGSSVYISFHSNGTTGDLGTATARGAIGLIDSSSPTPNQSSLALYTGRQINVDMQALNGTFEYNWSNRTSHSSSGGFGEIDLGAGAEMDATIIEVGFHDQTQDNAILRDPKGRDQIARSTYEATVEYFVNFGNAPKPTNVTSPSAPRNVQAISNAAGEVTVSWIAGPSSANGYNGANGSPATGYRVYASTDGYGFDGGTYVPGGATTSVTLTGYDAAIPYYFRVVAENTGGQSKVSEVLTALPSGGVKQVLIVNGFDRWERTQNFRGPFYAPAANQVDRVWSRYNNSFDYVVQTQTAIQAATPGVHVASTSNEAVISGAVDLTQYDTVIWMLGEESTTNRTFDATEQTKVMQFLAGGGNLFVTGSEIAWDLDQSNNGRTFFETALKGNYVADSANTYNVSAAAGGIFEGLTNFSFSNGGSFSNLVSQIYNVNSADVIAPQAGAVTALSYSGGASAAIQSAGVDGAGSLVMFGFPFESITSAASRAVVMERVLDFFGVSAPIAEPTADFDDDGDVDGADFLAWQIGLGSSGVTATRANGNANGDSDVNGDDLAVWTAQFRGSEEIAAAAAAPLAAGEYPQAAQAPLAAVAAGLNPVGAQPTGNLSGKVVYINGGHGITADTDGSGAWSFQRGLGQGMVEDLGNQDQMSFYADYLWRAGATVVPMRPVGYQPNEIVLDNDDVGVTYTGTWSNSTAQPYYGVGSAVGARTATSSATETATTKFTPNVTVAGFYPVYAWTSSGSTRAADQLYRVNHAGGSTEVKVNHRMVGNGLIYLGTYYFEMGTGGSVEVSNRSSEAGRTIVADMIRFGNGMGSMNRGGGVSGRSREDEAALYWIQWHAENSVGVPLSAYRSSTSNDRDATVSATPRYAAYMNRQAEGVPSDRLQIVFHSNATGGAPTARGVTVLHNTNSGGDTPHQLQLAQTLGTEINGDMVAQNGQFEHNWNNRGSNITYQADFNYGELNNAYINDEFDATIIEVAFHDNQLDAELMRDAKVRDALARSSYQGTVRFFNATDGGETSLTMLPGKVTQVRAESVGNDSVKLTWTAPTANAYNGDAATGYRVYGSTNGYGFDGGTFVAGGATTTFTINGLSTTEGAYFFKVVAVNSGGEGAASEVVAAIPADTTQKVLIVNGFDRLGRSQNPTQAVSGGNAERVRPRQSNSYDYAVQVADAIEANTSEISVDTASNEMLVSGAVVLASYDAVIWISGEESTADDSFNTTEQTLVTNYLAAGGKLFVAGAEIGWDLDAQGGGAAFYNTQLKADYVADDANSYSVNGSGAGIFSGLSFSFDNGALFYNTEFPDVMAATGGSTASLLYSTGGVAGVQYTNVGTGAHVVTFGFPFETITSAANRAAVMDRVLEYFGFTLVVEPTGDFDADGDGDGADFLTWQRNLGINSSATREQGDSNQDGAVNAADLSEWIAQFEGAPAVAAASLAGEGDDASALVALAQAHESLAASLPQGRANPFKAARQDASTASSCDASDKSLNRQVDEVYARQRQPSIKRKRSMLLAAEGGDATLVDLAFASLVDNLVR